LPPKVTVLVEVSATAAWIVMAAHFTRTEAIHRLKKTGARRVAQIGLAHRPDAPSCHAHRPNGPTILRQIFSGTGHAKRGV